MYTIYLSSENNWDARTTQHRLTMHIFRDMI